MPRKMTSIRLLFQLGTVVVLLNVSEFAYAKLPLPPRISANAFASNYATGQADMMLSLQAKQADGCLPTHNFYFNPSITYATNNLNQFDAGLGYRWIQTSKKYEPVILGGYVFGGYGRVEDNARLYIINPGVEVLAARWDAHLNAYFPNGDTHYLLKQVQRRYFTWHDMRTATDSLYRNSGKGADAKLGYQFSPESSLKGYVGSYYFRPESASPILGGKVELEYWPKKFLKVTSGYAYDGLNGSIYSLGLGVEFGGTRVHRANPCLEERITDPVERNMYAIGRGSTIPTRLVTEVNRVVVNQTNIAFFTQDGKPDNEDDLVITNCTFENPCGPKDFSQKHVDQLEGLLPDTTMYFNGGEYAGPDDEVILHEGQKMYGRTPDFWEPATGSQRSIIKTRLRLANNNYWDSYEDRHLWGEPGVVKLEPSAQRVTQPKGGDNLVDSLIIMPPSSGSTDEYPYGIWIDHYGKGTVSNSQIGDDSNRFKHGIRSSVRSDWGSSFIDNTDIFASERGVSYVPYGGVATTGTIRNSRIDVKVENGDASGSKSSGIFVTGWRNITIENSQITVNGDYARGITYRNWVSGTLKLIDSTLQVTGGTDVRGTTGVEGGCEHQEIINTIMNVQNTGSGTTIALDNKWGWLNVNGGQVSVSGGTPVIKSGVEVAYVKISPETVCMVDGNVVNCS